MAKYTLFQGLNDRIASSLWRHYSAIENVYRPLLFCLCILPFGVDAKQSCQHLTQLHWLQGQWQMTSPGKVTVESWQIVSDRTMEGISTTQQFKDGNITSHFEEHLRLVKMLDGLFYLARVPDNPMPVPFRAISCKPQEVTFENPKHDFPQRLRYQRSENILRVRVESFDGNGFELLLTKP